MMHCLPASLLAAVTRSARKMRFSRLQTLVLCTGVQNKKFISVLRNRNARLRSNKCDRKGSERIIALFLW